MADPLYVFKSEINSFHYLYGDAEHLRHLLEQPTGGSQFDTVRLSRSAILLYIFSLEALINKALGAFLPEKLRAFFLKREARLQTEDKWQLLPLLAGSDPERAFELSSYPWSHFSELVALRNDYVHPKHKRPAYYRAITSHKWTALSWKEIPADLHVKETEIVYRQTLIPKDPYAIRPEHVATAKKVVDDMIAALDSLLGGVLSQGDWLHQDSSEMIYPPGATFADLPKEVSPTSAPPLPRTSASGIDIT